MTIFLFSCTKEDMPQEEPKYFTSCEEMTDVTGLNLYPFEPLTEEEWLGDVLKQKRQIPEDFLHGMSTKALIYQISRYEEYYVMSGLARDRLDVIPSYYVRCLNMVAELMGRPDAGLVLVQILQKIDPTVIKRGEHTYPVLEPLVDCYFFFDCVQVFAAQPEIIGRMTDDDINLYVDEQLRLSDIIMEPIEGVKYPACMGHGLLGLCYVMMHYEFEPFMQLLEMDEGLRVGVFYGLTRGISAYTSSIMDCIEKFKNREK